MEPVQEEVDQLGNAVKSRFVEFLKLFSSEADQSKDDYSTGTGHGGDLRRDYLEILMDMKTRDSTTIYVDFSHVQEYDNYLADAIASKYYRFEPFLRQAIQNVVKQHMPDYETDDNDKHKEFWVSFYSLPSVCHLRELRTDKIGQLVAITGTITRTSEVRPELLFGAFSCLECGKEVENVAQQFRFTQPNMCRTPNCNNRDKWSLVRERCQFVDWQRVRIQENADEVPAGCLPRSMDAILRHETVEAARAGDQVVLTGQLMVVPDGAALMMTGDRSEARRAAGGRKGEGASEGNTGLKALGVRELHYRLTFMANSVVNTAAATQGMVNIRAEEGEDEDQTAGFSEEEMKEIHEMNADPEVYNNLALSIAPSIYGHGDIKRAVLLMLLGGVHKETTEGIQLRGDINVCIVGDPSCAKSQFLKYVTKFLPRAVYTSGKSSSAAGLTATVAKDQETGEFTIEAGALMLADNGICCIDEFDKMDSKDQVAIHEAMEQQTISLAKAGMKATLNARTSILAAANPAGGRYDRSKPLKYNVALPPAILSRFDLVHVMVDEIDEHVDYSIARHIVGVHQRQVEGMEEEERAPYTKIAMQRYIRYARSIKPVLSTAARKAIVSAYIKLRQGDAAPGSGTAYKITVRQLEAMVRLSEAMARLHHKKEISPNHVVEARRLLSNSIIHVAPTEVQMEPDYNDTPQNGDEFAQELAEVGGGAFSRVPTDEEMAAEASAAVDEAAEAAGVATETEEVDAEVAAAAAAAAAPKEELKVSSEKYHKVTEMLVKRLREAEDAGAAGLKQFELVSWYMDVHVQAQAFDSYESMSKEFKLVKAVINNLVKRDGTLIIIEEAESGAQRERVLAVNPNVVAAGDQ